MKECVEYFKNLPGFQRFVLELRKKYEKRGTFSGVIRLSNISDIEKRDLEKFFGESYVVHSDVKISVKAFDKKISKSRFEDFNMYDFVIEYFGIEELITKKEKEHLMEDEYVDYLNDLLNFLKCSFFVKYLTEVVQGRSNTAKIIRRRYKKNKNELRELLIQMDQLFCNIPKFPTSIPLFASITGNPHFLDFNTSSGNLFLRFLHEMKCVKAETLEEKLHLLEMINVYNDTISNQTLTYNLLGNDVLEKFNELGPVSLNMDNIQKLEKLSGIHGKIFIFENPSMLNYFKNKNVSIIVTSGVPNLSFYRLLEKIDEDTKLYYNGDYDPEGLLIANKIKLLYPRVNLFCYDEKDYVESHPCVKLNSSRLHKLDGCNVFDLNHVKWLMQEHQMAGYQENNLKRIEHFILKECLINTVNK